jgi:hypothetical protein
LGWENVLHAEHGSARARALPAPAGGGVVRVGPERYDRSRPRYPDAMVERIVGAISGADVLDMGCGTGIAARQFKAAGCRIFASSPTRGWPLGDALAAAARRVLPAPLADRLRARPRSNGSSTLSTNAADGIRQAGRFGEPEQWRLHWEQFCTRDEYLDGLPTAGFYTRLLPDKLEQLLADTSAAIDAAGVGFTVRYSTNVVTSMRTTTT